MFSTEIKVRFNHVDAAGIVFYPRYYEMFNQVIEEWCEAQLGIDFRELTIELESGFPVVSIHTDFIKPSRLGDFLRFDLSVENVGKSSVELAIKTSCENEMRLSAKLTLVYIQKLAIKAQEIPGFLKSRMLET